MGNIRRFYIPSKSKCAEIRGAYVFVAFLRFLFSIKIRRCACTGWEPPFYLLRETSINVFEKKRKKTVKNVSKYKWRYPCINSKPSPTRAYRTSHDDIFLLYCFWNDWRWPFYCCSSGNVDGSSVYFRRSRGDFFFFFFSMSVLVNGKLVHRT